MTALTGARRRHVESPTERLDRLLHASTAPWTGSLSPVSLALAWADWAWHLGVSPGRQMDLVARALQLGHDTLRFTAGQADDPTAGAADDDPRFRHPDWAQWPFNVWRHAFRNQESFWRDAARLPGMTAHHARETQFYARQILGMLTPANGLFTNPVVLRDAIESNGAHLLQGARHWLEDVAGQRPAPPPEQRFEVGRDVAVTPGQVVCRNRLIELIRYAPQTAKVHPEPLLIVPSWIMKYYILDLSPHNSMVRWLVQQGHTVYMLSWLNPDRDDHDLSMDDYLRLGVFEALRAIARLHGPRQAVHAAGYCLGGTLLAIAAAALGHRALQGSDALARLPPMATMTLLAAQTDFAEPGELGLFIDESQVGYLDEITRGQGYLSGRQMAGSFQFLHSRELVWSRRMREYLMGVRESRTDLTAWNADTTRLPARMHHEYLTGLYLHNALATSTWRVDLDGQPRAVSLADVRLPVFLVGTERDHISPWRSVYKLHHLCDDEITFVLASGGHNAGIVSEPGHAERWYLTARRAAHSPWLADSEWPARATRHEGSWWPAWHAWLAARSSPLRRAKAIPRSAALGPAPGRYVLKRYER